jgi:hypothetical protein
MIPTAARSNSPRVLAGARHFSAVASAAMVFSILCLLILCYFLWKRKKNLRRNNIAMDKCDKSKVSIRIDGSCKGKLTEEESSTCKDKENLGSDVIDVESQMASSSGVIELVTDSMSTRIVSSFSASSNKLIPKEPSVSTTRSYKTMPNSPDPSSSSFCQTVGHKLNSFSGRQSVEGMDRPSSQFSSYQSSLSKFIESLGTFSSLFSFDARSNSANRETNKETKAYSSSVSRQSSNALSAHGSKSGVKESESTSNHGQPLQIDNLLSLQCSLETKDMPSSQFPSSVSDQTGGDMHSTWFGSDQRNSDSHRIMKQEIITHSSSQPCQSSDVSSKIYDKSGGTDSECFSAHDRCPQSRQIVNSPSFLQRYVEVKDMPSNQFSSHASHQSSFGSLIGSPDTHPSDQNDNSRNGQLCNEGSIHSVSQAYKSREILSSHDSNGSVEDLSTKGYPSVSEQTDSNPSTITVSDEEATSYQSIFKGFVQKIDAISSLFRKQRSIGSQEMNKVEEISSSSLFKESSMKKIPDNDFSTSKINQLESLSSLKSSSMVVDQEPISSKDNSQLYSHGKENLVTVSSKNSAAKNQMKASPSKDYPQGSIYSSQSSNVLSPHDSNDGRIDELKSLSTSKYHSQSGHIQESVSIVSDSEETWDKPSSQFPSYESYQSIFSGFVRSLDAISSLFRSQQNRSEGSQELNSVARSSSASRPQQSFPTHQSQSRTKGYDGLSSLQSSSINALQPLPYKDHSQLSLHETENVVDQHPVISMTRLSKTGSSATASSINNVTRSVIKPTASKDNYQGSMQDHSQLSLHETENVVDQHPVISMTRLSKTGSSATASSIKTVTKSVIKPTTSKDNSQGSIQGIETVSNHPVGLASLCRHDSSAMAATTNKKKIGSTIITNVATASSNFHSEIPLHSIKSQVNCHNPETLQASLCKQNSSTVESGTKTVSSNSMGVLVAPSKRDAQGSLKKTGILSTNSFGFATIHESPTAVCSKKRTSGRILDDSQGVNNRITLSSISSGTSSSRSDYSSTSSEESEVATKSKEKFFSAFLRDLRPRVTNSGVEISQNSETSRGSSAFHESNYSPKSSSARRNSSSSCGTFDASREFSTKSVADVTESSVSDTSIENLVPYGCVTYWPSSSSYDSFTNAFIKSMSASTNDQPQSPVSAKEYSSYRIPLILSENYSRDDSFAAAYIKSLSVSSDDYSLGPPSVLKIPLTSVKRNHGSSAIVSNKNNVGRELFDLLSGFESHVTGDGVEVVGKSEDGASSNFASRHTISHSTCSKTCPGLPSQASGSSSTVSKPSRTACDSEKSHSSGIEVSASWLRGNETSSNLSHDESINSSCNSTISKSESQLSGNSSTSTADLQADGGQMGLCFFPSTIPYSASTASHETDTGTC